MTERRHSGRRIGFQAAAGEVGSRVEASHTQLLSCQVEVAGPKLGRALDAGLQLPQVSLAVAALAQELGQVEARFSVIGVDLELLTVEGLGAGDVAAGLADAAEVEVARGQLRFELERLAHQALCLFHLPP